MPKSEATIKGHLIQIMKNTRSMATNKKIRDKHVNTYPGQEKNNGKTELVMATVNEAQKIYTDQTGKFLIKFSQRNNYVLIMYVCNANSILAEPLKSRSGRCILEAYVNQVEHLTNRGYRPQVHC